jgi:hypothetical protein
MNAGRTLITYTLHTSDNLAISLLDALTHLVGAAQANLKGSHAVTGAHLKYGEMGCRQAFGAAKQVEYGCLEIRLASTF